MPTYSDLFILSKHAFYKDKHKIEKKSTKKGDSMIMTVTIHQPSCQQATATCKCCSNV